MRAHRYGLIPEGLDTGDALHVVLRAPVAQQLLSPVGQLLARCQGYKTMIIKATALTTKPAADIQKQHESFNAEQLFSVSETAFNLQQGLADVPGAVIAHLHYSMFNS